MHAPYVLRHNTRGGWVKLIQLVRRRSEDMASRMTGRSVVTSYEEIDRVAGLIIEATTDLRDRFIPLIEGGTDERAAAWVRGTVRDTAMVWAEALLNPTSEAGWEVARLALKTLQGDQPEPAFWGTELGQLLLMHDAFPDRPATRVEAAAVLDYTQAGIRQMTLGGKLKAAEGTDVTRESLMEIWRLRHRERELRKMLGPRRD